MDDSVGKRAEINRLSRVVGAAVPQPREKGRILAATPQGRILRGIYLENSSVPSRAYVWFVQPLYIPAATVVFNFGMRLGGRSKTWGWKMRTS